MSILLFQKPIQLKPVPVKGMFKIWPMPARESYNALSYNALG